MTNGTVTQIAGNDVSNFVVTVDYGNSTKTVRTRKIVLATGLQDNLPSTPGLLESWGKGIYWVCTATNDLSHPTVLTFSVPVV